MSRILITGAAGKVARQVRPYLGRPGRALRLAAPARDQSHSSCVCDGSANAGTIPSGNGISCALSVIATIV